MCNLYKSKIFEDFLKGRIKPKVIEENEIVEAVKLEFIEPRLIEYFNRV